MTIFEIAVCIIAVAETIRIIQNTIQLAGMVRDAREAKKVREDFLREATKVYKYSFKHNEDGFDDLVKRAREKIHAEHYTAE